jgi:hypothetical protein
VQLADLVPTLSNLCHALLILHILKGSFFLIINNYWNNDYDVWRKTKIIFSEHKKVTTSSELNT